MYAGLDSHLIGIYHTSNGTKHIIPERDLSEYLLVDGTYLSLFDGKYPIEYKSVARSMKNESLVYREYLDGDGETKVKLSITHSPMLKSKLLGVLAGIFIKAGKVFVSGTRMGSKKRLTLAESLGFVLNKESETHTEDVLDFLKSKGMEVIISHNKYGKHYYDYKNRLNNDPRHKDKTPLHKHRMAIRFMIKRFLVDLYTAWRTIEGLPVAVEYSEAKFGKVHGIAGGNLPIPK